MTDTRFDVALKADGRCTLRAEGFALETACAGGAGAPAATDLLAAALSSCIAATALPILARHGLGPDDLGLRVTARRDAGDVPIALDVALRVSARVAPAVQTRLLHAAARCPVRRALHPDLPVTVWLEQQSP
ncbi:MAG TPA: OsmC family protein [Gammaproteobacteria bacterium]|nr:OsmC family protein [Gammaproteobacteria bacterium]